MDLFAQPVFQRGVADAQLADGPIGLQIGQNARYDRFGEVVVRLLQHGQIRQHRCGKRRRKFNAQLTCFRRESARQRDYFLAGAGFIEHAGCAKGLRRQVFQHLQLSPGRPGKILQPAAARAKHQVNLVHTFHAAPPGHALLAARRHLHALHSPGRFIEHKPGCLQAGIYHHGLVGVVVNHGCQFQVVAGDQEARGDRAHKQVAGGNDFQFGFANQ